MFQKLSTGCYELYIEDLPQAKASEKGSQRSDIWAETMLVILATIYWHLKSISSLNHTMAYWIRYFISFCTWENWS